MINKKAILNNRKLLVSIWLFINILALVLFLCVDKASIQTDMISIIPRLANSADFEKPIRDYFTQSSTQINIFIESNNFDNAYTQYQALQEYINEHFPSLEMSSGYEVGEVMSFFDEYKYHFLSRNIADELLLDNARSISQAAIMNIFSPMSSVAFVDIQKDPFLLTHHKSMEIIDLLSMGNQSLQMRGDVLVSTFEGKENIFLTLNIDSDNQDFFLDSFLPFVESLNGEDVYVYMAGVPLHSYYSKKMAQRDIFIISMLSLGMIFVLFFITFRSVKPYIISVVTILTSSLFAYFMTSVLFDSIHIFTFVFGTSLIGITIDYSIHFLSDFIYEKDSSKTLKSVGMPIVLACFTTIISYVFLSFSSVSILKTLALFSILGMFNTILTVLIIYPIICGHIFMGNINNIVAMLMTSLLCQYSRFKKYYKLGFVLASLLSIGTISILGIKHNFTANALYQMPQSLEQNEIAIAKRLGSDSISKMIFVGGQSVDDLLVKEEAIKTLLEGHKVLSISSILPSKQKQIANINLVQNALLPYLDEQLKILGFDSVVHDNIIADFEKAKTKLLDIDILTDSFLASLVKGRIVEADNRYYLAIMCSGEIEQSVFTNISKQYADDVVVFNMNEEINTSIKLATIEAIKFTAFAYIAIFILIIILFKSKSIAIIAIQSLSLLLTILAHSIFRIELNMFSVLAIILSLGISIDYILFFIKQEDKKQVVFVSILLSMLTTILSFSTLSFSSFVPVRSFGLSLLFGVLFSFILSPIVNVYSKSKSLPR